MGLHSVLRVARASVPVAAVVWATLIVAAPWSDEMPAAGGAARLVAAGTYLAGATVCHQRPDRSFHAHGAQWPVCARCSGLYLSAAAGVVAAWVLGRRRLAIRFATWRTILLAAALPTAVTLVLERLNPGWAPSLVRALAAAPLGAATGVLVAASMSFRGRLEGCERTP